MAGKRKLHPDMHKSGVYQIKNTINNKIYIGSAAGRSGFTGRWHGHRCHLRKNKHANKKLQNSWNKYGEKYFKFCIIEITSKNKAVSREQHYLDTLNPEFNILKVAGSMLGHKLSPETIQKLKGRIPWNKGNKAPKKPYPYMTEKELAHSMKKANKKRSKAMSGRKKDRDVVERIAQKRRIPVIAKNRFTNNEIRFEGVRRAADALDLDVSMISKVCKGKHKYYKEWTFIYGN